VVIFRMFYPPAPLQRIDSPPATLSPHLTLTNSGEIYYEHARRILADLERGWRNLSAISPWSSDIKKSPRLRGFSYGTVWFSSLSGAYRGPVMPSFHWKQ
jgi:hypothetical protein